MTKSKQLVDDDFRTLDANKRNCALKSLPHECNCDRNDTFKWITALDKKGKALMEDKSERINKRDIIDRVKSRNANGGNRSPFADTSRPRPVIDQVFPSAWQIAVITERIKLFIKNNKLSIMYGRNRQGTDAPE